MKVLWYSKVRGCVKQAFDIINRFEPDDKDATIGMCAPRPSQGAHATAYITATAHKDSPCASFAHSCPHASFRFGGHTHKSNHIERAHLQSRTSIGRASRAQQRVLRLAQPEGHLRRGGADRLEVERARAGALPPLPRGGGAARRRAQGARRVRRRL
eukprot:5427792-Prymnesium_polylepis.1